MANMSIEVTCGTYQFRVEHSNTHGIPFSSPIFNLNGIDCKIVYFPQGYDNNGKTVGLRIVAILSASYNEVPKRFVNSILPFGIDDHFVQLLEKKEMADVSFDIDGEICTAHRLILAGRSPVFYGVLSGLMTERKMETIALKDIKPVIFKAMLHFIYTDSGFMCSFCQELNLEKLKEKCLIFICNPLTLALLAVTDYYVQLMQRYPALLKEIGDQIRYKTQIICPTQQIKS
ncbi:hypothetical protein LUZ63_000251 [Rhynchospora breviuscula]|uniref:BTB domain-containing protein n=1 Tax=Rhynchospora breviuscula TaxID=2022672 RepID=A0A9Q0CUN3_9POAL|nr:hypothetical protein LUZ63_000251 [Rhynchospora breviuscula]